MKYKIALVTNESWHHKYWIAELHQKLDICLVIHPRKKKSLVSKLVTIKRKKIFQYGMYRGFLKILSLIYNRIFSISRDMQLKNLGSETFQEFEQEYNNIPKDRFYITGTVNSEACIKKIKEHDIDFIFFLGGDIAHKEFINSPKLRTLNFHSGISPFYNGNKTNYHAYINEDFHLIGGTLMYMTEKIDGGKIISHTLPKIKSNDNATVIFYRNIRMAVKAYIDFIEHMSSSKILPSGIDQEFFHNYLRNIDWGLKEDIRLFIREKKGIPSTELRDSRILHYFDNESKIPDFLLEKIGK